MTTDDHALKTARGAFKAGDTDMPLTRRQAVNDATHTARTGHDYNTDGRRVPTVTVYFREDVVDVTEDESDNEMVDDALDTIVSKHDLTPLRYDESQNAVVFIRSEDSAFDGGDE